MSADNETDATEHDDALLRLQGILIDLEPVALERIRFMRRIDPGYNPADDSYLVGFIAACCHVKQALDALRPSIAGEDS